MTSFRGSVRTINETSFAVAYGDATALILDAITLIGVERKARLQHAKGRLSDAFLYAVIDEEIELARALDTYLVGLRNRRMDV